MTSATAFNHFLKTAVSAARAAGKIQRAGYHRPHHIQFKGQANLVTEVDFACQKKIISILRKKFPKHDFLAEEKGAPRQKSTHVWHIDPLDGTTNYAHNYPAFCVSIGLEIDGVMNVGVVYYTMRDEMFTAIRGKGAHLNGRRIHVSPSKKFETALLATGFSHDQPSMKRNLKNFGKALFEVQGMRRSGSAAIDLAFVACGRVEAYWDLSLQPWDVAAGTLLVTEAGGRVSLANGKTYSIYNGDVLATNGHMHSRLVRLLKP